MLLGAVEQVECIGGCGGGTGEPSAAVVIGVAAALASLGVAFYAIKISLSSLRIAEEQHDEFLKKLAATADFELEIRATGEGEVVESVADQVEIIWVIEITNTGDKPAEHVGVAFTAPESVRELKWMKGDEDSIRTDQVGPFRSTPDLVTQSGISVSAQTTTKIADRVGRASRFSNVTGTVVLPEEIGQDLIVPVRLKVMSDDLPADVPYRSCTHEIVLRRVEG